MNEDQRLPTYEELAVLVRDQAVLAQQQAALVERQQVLIESQAARIAELEARLGLSSKNSSKPSGANPFVKPKSLRGKSGRKPGGQSGHQGRTLERVADPDRVVEHRPLQCDGCGAGLAEAATAKVEARQVFDLPEIRPEVTEHRLVSCRCDCGAETKAAAPARVAAPVQYGPTLAAIVVYLYEGQFLSKERTAQAMGELFAAPVSTATVEAMADRAAASIRSSGFTERAVAYLAAAASLHVDETGLRVAGKLAWLHVASCASVALFLAHPGRGREAIKAMGVLARAVGVVHHDCWAPYDHADFGIERHQLCGAHLLREFQAVCDTAGAAHGAAPCWSCAAREALLDAKSLVDAVAALGKDRIDPGRLEEARHRLISAAWLGRSQTEQRRNNLEKKANALARRVIDRLADYWRFTHDPWAVFDNNTAEREIRMTKIKNKVSGGLRSLEGAQRYAMLRSYLHTAAKHGVSFLDALKAACAGTPWLLPNT